MVALVFVLAILLLPHGNILLLPLLPFLEVLRVLCLLKGMPVVEDPVWRLYFTLKCHATRAVGNWKRSYSIVAEM